MGRLKESIARRDLNDLPEIHHRDTVSDIANHAEIVRSKEHGQSKISPQRRQEHENLRPHGNVQRRYGLIGNNDPRIERERAPNGDPLALTAGKFMRKAVDIRTGWRQSNQFEQPPHFTVDFGRTGKAMQL